MASVIGKQLDESGTIGTYTTTNNYELGLMEEGKKSADEMFENALNNQQLYVWFARFLLLLWSFGITIYFLPQYSPSVVCYFSLCLSGIFLSCMNTFIWGFNTYASLGLGVSLIFLILGNQSSFVKKKLD